MRLTLTDLATATGGSVAGDAATVVDGLGIDSRALPPGAGFVALVAERDGHDFVAGAVAAGAVAVVASRPVGDVGVPVLLVPDTAAALLAIGRLARSRLPDRVVGITGSVGKTSTKDMLASLLAARWTTAASARSFNNEIGVPLTLVAAPADTGAAVIEMGARGPGHIALLCTIARPTAAIVTAVADAHLEMFGSIDEVARAKGELVEALPSDGVAVLNADDPRVAAMAGRTSASVLTYGVGKGSTADVVATDVELDDLLRPRLVLRSPWGVIPVRLRVHGAHQAANAVAAAACALALGVDLDDVVEALGAAAISGMRMQVDRAPSGLVVVNDAYNANPTSTRAALDALAALPVTGRKVAVLGLMAELGPDADELHRGVAAAAADRGIEVVSVAAPAYGAATAVDDPADAVGCLRGLAAGDAVLIKGSRVAGLEAVAESLLAAEA
ncbi:UDP-N-acetylmuramoyl-tripeptide--D-alanyl-D-alanine ligase [Iamia sp. SCSIO 61187]|uniref:UDP-N-acetylmuramoyl-tripeptide--D-alanyl-D- alanine ligase n=1 Tax=Iamia sp. SCSIO 61187 TaxID=2722752 RepID=UPI001C62857A|nr:UDP-N-acetylmuramoyl-tripeptide--D-alanyl-D-alanine ligase [Iamia sp. SCSIO 61187]QYG93593.1 UDP-N-acetylmuramoyl-tripeptide--D-alanyl-D-alanine ligase [Iamia sp. SCSIO 61187]